MNLLALQRDFCQRLTKPSPARRGAKARGLAVYHNAYRVRLTDCLAETFAQVRAWLGGEAFLAAARTHIEDCPPAGWTLAAYGAQFDGTLAALYPDDPEVAELAQLEWLVSRVFESADAAALSADAVAGVDWDCARVSFVPSVRIRTVRTNAGAIWSALTAGTAPPDAAYLPKDTWLLVWRQGFTPCFRMIEADEHGAIASLNSGVSFAVLCAQFVEAKGEAAGVELAGALLGEWLAGGLIARIDVGDLTAARRKASGVARGISQHGDGTVL